MPPKSQELRQKWRVAKDRLKETCHSTHDTMSHIFYSGAVSHCETKTKTKLSDVFLRYDDTRLTNADYFALRWQHWFTDNVRFPLSPLLLNFAKVNAFMEQIIAFYERFLEHTLLKSQQNKIVLLRPTMAQMLLLTPNPRSIRTALPDIRKAEHVAIILNNNMDGRFSDGGTHWSLVWVSMAQRLSLHYDSLPRGGNRSQAKIITKALSIILKTELEFVHMKDNPIQRNGFDCGLRACVTLEFLIENVFQNRDSGEPDDEYSLSLKGWDIDTHLSRRELQFLVERLRAANPG